MIDAAMPGINQPVQAGVTIPAVINPSLRGAVSLTLTDDLDPGQQHKTARQVILTTAIPERSDR